MKRRYSLLYLAPYLERHRYQLAAGFLMVLLTVSATMFSPWVLKYVVDSLQVSLSYEKLPRYAAMILGISLVEGFFRFWMRKILIGVSRDHRAAQLAFARARLAREDVPLERAGAHEFPRSGLLEALRGAAMCL